MHKRAHACAQKITWCLPLVGHLLFGHRFWPLLPLSGSQDAKLEKPGSICIPKCGRDAQVPGTPPRHTLRRSGSAPSGYSLPARWLAAVAHPSNGDDDRGWQGSEREKMLRRREDRSRASMAQQQFRVGTSQIGFCIGSDLTSACCLRSGLETVHGTKRMSVGVSQRQHRTTCTSWLASLKSRRFVVLRARGGPDIRPPIPLSPRPTRSWS